MKVDASSFGVSDMEKDQQSVHNGQINSFQFGKLCTTEKEEENVLRENIHDVCFWMNAEAMNEV